MDKVKFNLAENLLALRKKRGWTQGALASASDIRRSTITLLESGDGNPTLEVLLKVSQALGVSMEELVTTPRVECRHYRASEIPLDKKSKDGVALRKLLPDKIRATEIDELQLESGALMKGSPHIEGTREYFTCIEGKISIGVLGEIYHLKKGDVLSFPGGGPHSYKNSGQSKARGISVVLAPATVSFV